MKIKNINIYSFVKIFLVAGVLILFLGSFFKIYIYVPNNLSLKIVFIILYLWFTAVSYTHLTLPTNHPV